jgi:hypothetical protein
MHQGPVGHERQSGSELGVVLAVVDVVVEGAGEPFSESCVVPGIPGTRIELGGVPTELSQRLNGLAPRRVIGVEFFQFLRFPRGQNIGFQEVDRIRSGGELGIAERAS